jgi:hypothetical protein
MLRYVGCEGKLFVHRPGFFIRTFCPVSSLQVCNNQRRQSTPHSSNSMTSHQLQVCWLTPRPFPRKKDMMGWGGLLFMRMFTLLSTRPPSLYLTCALALCWCFLGGIHIAASDSMHAACWVVQPFIQTAHGTSHLISLQERPSLAPPLARSSWLPDASTSRDVLVACARGTRTGLYIVAG